MKILQRKRFNSYGIGYDIEITNTVLANFHRLIFYSHKKGVLIYKGDNFIIIIIFIIIAVMQF